MKKLTTSALMLMPILLLAGNVALGQATDAPSGSMSHAPVAPDNSKSNKLDETNTNPVADNQKDNASDLKITQTIRRSVMADKSLSVYAHNAKIISVNGTVTLNGVVHNEAESSNLAQKAAQVVGNNHVVNKLKIDGAK